MRKLLSVLPLVASLLPAAALHAQTTVPANVPVDSLQPPPISLHLKDATGDEAADALSRALGVKLTYPMRRILIPGAPVRRAPLVSRQPPSGQADLAATTNRAPQEQWPRFTIDADNQPFWDIFAALSRQGFVYQTTPSEEYLPVPIEISTVAPSVRQQGFIAFPTAVLRQNDLQAIEPPQFSLSFGIGYDPRIGVLESYLPRITKITDAAGNELPLVRRQTTWRSATNETSTWLLQSQAFRMSNSSTTTFNAQGEGRFLVRTAGGRIEIPNPETKIGQQFNFGKETLLLQTFETSGNQVQCIFQRVDAPAGAPPLNGNVTVISPAGQVTVRLAAGSPITARIPAGRIGRGAGMPLPPAPAPVSIAVEVISESSLITIPFEFKSLTLP